MAVSFPDSRTPYPKRHSPATLGGPWTRSCERNGTTIMLLRHHTATSAVVIVAPDGSEPPSQSLISEYYSENSGRLMSNLYASEVQAPEYNFSDFAAGEKKSSALGYRSEPAS